MVWISGFLNKKCLPMLNSTTIKILKDTKNTKKQNAKEMPCLKNSADALRKKYRIALSSTFFTNGDFGLLDTLLFLGEKAQKR
jgi:hypothetical protein